MTQMDADFFGNDGRRSYERMPLDWPFVFICENLRFHSQTSSFIGIQPGSTRY